MSGELVLDFKSRTGIIKLVTETMPDYVAGTVVDREVRIAHCNQLARVPEERNVNHHRSGEINGDETLERPGSHDPADAAILGLAIRCVIDARFPTPGVAAWERQAAAETAGVCSTPKHSTGANAPLC